MAVMPRILPFNLFSSLLLSALVHFFRAFCVPTGGTLIPGVVTLFSPLSLLASQATPWLSTDSGFSAPQASHPLG